MQSAIDAISKQTRCHKRKRQADCELQSHLQNIAHEWTQQEFEAAYESQQVTLQVAAFQLPFLPLVVCDVIVGYCYISMDVMNNMVELRPSEHKLPLESILTIMKSKKSFWFQSDSDLCQLFCKHFSILGLRVILESALTNQAYHRYNGFINCLKQCIEIIKE
jgi:hypothetical protein